jgi:hypothetical protein
MTPESRTPPDDDEQKCSDSDEIPRKTLLAAMPKRSFFRVLVLLAALAGIVYLRERTASIAGCMSTAFNIIPPPAVSSSAGGVRARIELHVDASAKARE